MRSPNQNIFIYKKTLRLGVRKPTNCIKWKSLHCGPGIDTHFGGRPRIADEADTRNFWPGSTRRSRSHAARFDGGGSCASLCRGRTRVTRAGDFWRCLRSGDGLAFIGALFGGRTLPTGFDNGGGFSGALIWRSSGWSQTREGFGRRGPDNGLAGAGTALGRPTNHRLSWNSAAVALLVALKSKKFLRSCQADQKSMRGGKMDN